MNDYIINSPAIMLSKRIARMKDNDRKLIFVRREKGFMTGSRTVIYSHYNTDGTIRNETEACFSPNIKYEMIKINIRELNSL